MYSFMVFILVGDKMANGGQAGDCARFIERYNDTGNKLTINGSELTIPELVAVCRSRHVTVEADDTSKQNMQENYEYLAKKVASGTSIYGVNTGYGGTADVRSSDTDKMQRSLVRHLNAGFGKTIDPENVKGLMLLRANSLCRGYSGVRPKVVQLILDMLNNDIIPVIPLRGSVSASGDLMPTSYLAASMMGLNNVNVIASGKTMLALDAMKQANLNPIAFQSKEALAVVNSASVAASLASSVLFDANTAVLLTQIATSMTTEAMNGHIESFHPTVHGCLFHPGQSEVARNIRGLLKDSKFLIQDLEIHCEDSIGRLKQDRYGIRTSPQWLGPVAETLQESNERITSEINSANDNPIIDHRSDEVIHGGNFQGASITVAMDQTRQALQMCGKLLFGQMSELVNVKLSNGLPPNLCGSDTNTDMGYKETDTAMASYCSELDYLGNGMMNHVLSAELHNQSVNSLALISARMTLEALEILQMMLTNIFCAQAQAIDLRWLQGQVECILNELFKKFHIPVKRVNQVMWPWYEFAFTPEKTANTLYTDIFEGETNPDFVNDLVSQLEIVMNKLRSGQCISEVAALLGVGEYKFSEFYLIGPSLLVSTSCIQKRKQSNQPVALKPVCENV